MHPDRATPAERAARVRFRRAVALMVMTLLAPGSAQLVAGNRRVGRIALRIWLGLLVTGFAVLLVSLLHHRFAYGLVTDAGTLLLVQVGLTLGAVAWAALFVDAWRIGQPLTLSLNHRRAVIGVNGLLCFSVMGTLLFGAHIVGVSRGVLATFASGDASGAHGGRYNVLLLGGDAGKGRTGLRPDSLNVASIDAETGRTVLISLPRNMANFPFAKGSVMREQFPHGFDCDGCYLNGVSTWAMDNTELFPGSDHPGVDATVMAVEGITGLRINYWAMVNLEGFKDLVDAVGGVTLNVRDRIPVGLPSDDFHTWIEPGVKELNGFETLWFARARYDSDDYSRMARQKCVMNAMLEQLSPQDVLRNFERIATASSAMVSTNLPASELDTFLDLAMKARSQKISTLSLVPPMISTADPDIRLVRSKVAEAIDRAEGKKPAPQDKPADDAAQSDDTASAGGEQGGKKQEPAAGPTPVTGGSLGSLREGYVANQAEDLGAAC